MAKAVVDPDELRRFATELQRFNVDLQERAATLNHQFSRLGESWRDQEHVKFGEEFKQMVAALAKFVDASERHVPVLMRKAERIRDYLDQR